MRKFWEKVQNQKVLGSFFLDEVLLLIITLVTVVIGILTIKEALGG